MSVLIRGMEMPKNCIECPMQFGGMCYVQPEEINEPRVANTPLEVKGRASWCPLEEVKEAEFKMHKEYVGGDSKIPVYGWMCTACGGIVGINIKEYNYCPCCGAKIKGVKT